MGLLPASSRRRIIIRRRIIAHQRKPRDCSCTKWVGDGPSAEQVALGEPATRVGKRVQSVPRQNCAIVEPPDSLCKRALRIGQHWHHLWNVVQVAFRHDSLALSLGGAEPQGLLGVCAYRHFWEG